MICSKIWMKASGKTYNVIFKKFTVADAWANLGSALNIPVHIKIPIIHVTTPNNRKTIKGQWHWNEDLAFQSRSDSTSWLEPWIISFRKYIKERSHPWNQNKYEGFQLKKIIVFILLIIYYVENHWHYLT